MDAWELLIAPAAHLSRLGCCWPSCGTNASHREGSKAAGESLQASNVQASLPLQERITGLSAGADPIQCWGYGPPVLQSCYAQL